MVPAITTDMTTTLIKLPKTRSNPSPMTIAQGMESTAQASSAIINFVVPVQTRLTRRSGCRSTTYNTTASRPVRSAARTTCSIGNN